MLSTEEILGHLTSSSAFPVEHPQLNAWRFQINHLKSVLDDLPDAYIFLEFMIPRMGRRVDAVVLLGGVIFVIEYKVGATAFATADVDQVVGYAMDLQNFHSTSHDRCIVPVLIATKAATSIEPADSARGEVRDAERISAGDLKEIFLKHSLEEQSEDFDAQVWAAGRYKPTPTIVEAAQALYRGHSVDDISRNEAGAENLSVTSSYIASVVARSRQEKIKSICFVTGVPGSGKTLAGLNLANATLSNAEGHAVFLSGNGPLVDVLRTALTDDRLAKIRAEEPDRKVRRAEVERQTEAFIQNIHHFRDEYAKTSEAPSDHVVVFDEAQRAWDESQASKFMQKRGYSDFSQSEPGFLLSVMDRHPEWATVVCLVGGGQEINTGEAGITEWLTALEDTFPNWEVHVANTINGPDYLDGQASPLLTSARTTLTDKLHLGVSIRSYRAEALSEFVGAIIDNDDTRGRMLRVLLVDYPIFITRDLTAARRWLRAQRRGNERTGLLASSNALRLKPEGIFVKAAIEPSKWFLAPSDDVRSSNALEDSASEFDVQGLELDWTCVCWDANLRRSEGEWKPYNFVGTKWQTVELAQRKKYVLNAYRVLLTRARQGMVIFVPKGDKEDATRSPKFYDGIYQFFATIGIQSLPAFESSKDRRHQFDDVEEQAVDLTVEVL